jgi:hypothetical protein
MADLVYNNKYQPLEQQQSALRELYKQQTIKSRVISKQWDQLNVEKQKLASGFVELQQRISEFLQEKQTFEAWAETKEKEINNILNKTVE